MVDEDAIGRKKFAHGGGIELDEAFPLGLGQILEIGRFEILVAVEDEDRQGPVDRGSNDLDTLEAFVPVRMRVLAEDDDLMSETAPGARQGARIDIRSRASEEVAVPKENLHAWLILTDLS
jgi:hypothetical protein